METSIDNVKIKEVLRDLNKEDKQKFEDKRDKEMSEDFDAGWDSCIETIWEKLFGEPMEES